MRRKLVEICGINTAKLKVLSEEEKRALLVRAKAGDNEARDALTIGNLRLVLSVIQRFNPKHESFDDLFQVGCLGLIKAIDNFNLEMDVRFSTYAVPMIIGEVRRYQRDNNAVRVARSVRDLAYRALQVKEEISRSEGREATVKEIAERLGESEKAVGEAVEAIVEPVSLYESVYNDGDESVYVIDQIKNSDDCDELWIEDIALKEALKKLGERERSIITKRFYNGKTQMEIAAEIGISQAQVSRLEKSAIDKIRKEM
jgi:RNA polymerase sporulation-specific sigma factor